MILFISILAVVVGGLVVFYLQGKKAGLGGVCLICEKGVEKAFYHDGYSFCSEHIGAFRSGKWKLLQEGEASEADPEFGVNLYELKKALVENSIPSFIQASYKERNGKVVTRMKLLTLEKDWEKARAFSQSR